ncbi:type II toxin-antitoxin system RelE/ParE family toxin [Avibacterium gallinarum]|uniref:type II toxin-antitoxin system RelE/ParE family toxin n=1 Tax=Avibacterium gallinarum TaxID=755 RepID=UPI003BF80712
MIKSFKHKGLQQYFEKGITKGLRADHLRKIGGILDLIDRSTDVVDFQMLYQCHKLKGDREGIWSMTVSGNWRITFEFINGDAYILNYEDYH